MKYRKFGGVLIYREFPLVWEFWKEKWNRMRDLTLKNSNSLGALNISQRKLVKFYCSCLSFDTVSTWSNEEVWTQLSCLCFAPLEGWNKILGLSMGKRISPFHKTASSLMDTPGTRACYPPRPELSHPEGADEPHHLRTLLRPKGSNP